MWREEPKLSTRLSNLKGLTNHLLLYNYFTAYTGISKEKARPFLEVLMGIVKSDVDWKDKISFFILEKDDEITVVSTKDIQGKIEYEGTLGEITIRTSSGHYLLDFDFYARNWFLALDKK